MTVAKHQLSTSFRLVDPYNAPTLYLRRPGDDMEERREPYDFLMVESLL